MTRTGIRVVAPFLFLLLSVTNAHAMYSYSQVNSTLNELSASAVAPDGPHLQVVQIGSTVKGRPILMAVLSAAPVEVPQAAGPDEPTSDEPPAPGVDAPEGGAPEAAPAEPAPTAAAAPSDAPPADSLVLTLEPEGGQAAPAVAALPAGGEASPVAANPDAQAASDTLELESQSQGNPRRVLILCRQHGNEPASTEAAMQFLKEYATTTDPQRMEILRRVTFLVVPMLNVDGAEKYERRNARNVDLNRDWLSQSQPETRTVVRTVRAWRPDLMMDLHELATSDWTPSFVEAMEAEAGTTAEIGDSCNAAIAAVVGPLRQQSMRINARPVFNYRAPRLAHRYFAIKRGVPAILVETRRAGSVPLESRAAVHYAAIVATARYAAGEKAETPSRVIAEWVEPGAAGSYREIEARRAGSNPAFAAALAERHALRLASRSGHSSIAQRRAALAKKLAARKKRR